MMAPITRTLMWTCIAMSAPISSDEAASAPHKNDPPNDTARTGLTTRPRSSRSDARHPAPRPTGVSMTDRGRQTWDYAPPSYLNDTLTFAR